MKSPTPRRICIPLVLLGVVAAGCTAFVLPVKVEGTAMVPALQDGDRIIIERNPSKLERGDIVIFYFPLDQRKSYLKRIVGLPNETVDIREGKVFINGRLLEEPYVDPKLNLSMRNLPEIKLPEDAYFVIGDNRDNSADSRIWGPLQKKFIYGKYMTKYL